MVDWLAGNRVRGTSTERTTSAGFNDGFTGVGGWVELGRHTLGSTASEVFVASLPDKQYYMVLYEDKGQASAQARLLRYNSDSGSNYANRVSTNGASDTTNVSQPQHNGWNANNVTPQFNVWYIANQSGKEKLLMSQGVAQSTAGAATAPTRTEYVGKSTLSAVINRIGVIQNAGVHGVGTTITVLGWDPADTHTTNFWEELASVSGDGTSTTLDTGSFTAKKYLMFQVYLEASSNLTTQLWRFNSDSGSNYASRYSRNGTEGTNASISHMNINVTGATSYKNHFYTGFIINNTSNEKLVICHGTVQDTAGSATEPKRVEVTPKWANTSSQITSIQVVQANSVNFGAGSIIKVWGSD